MLTGSKILNLVNASIQDRVKEVWMPHLKTLFGDRVWFKFYYPPSKDKFKDFVQKRRTYKIYITDDEGNKIAKSYDYFTGGLAIGFRGNKKYPLFKEELTKIMGLDINKALFESTLKPVFIEEEHNFNRDKNKKNKHYLFFSYKLLVNLINNKGLISESQRKLIEKIRGTEKRITGISTSKDGKSITYNKGIKIVLADMETFLEIPEDKLNELKSILSNKYEKYRNLSKWKKQLKYFLMHNAKTVPYAISWCVFDSDNINELKYDIKDVKFSFNIDEFINEILELSKSNQVLTLWYNASYDTVILANYLRENYSHLNIIFEYDPWNNKSKFRNGIFINLNENNFIEAQDLYVFFRKPLKEVAKFIKGLEKGEIPYDMVNAKVMGNSIQYLSFTELLNIKSFPLKDIEIYTKNDIVLLKGALKHKLEVLNIINDTAIKSWDKEVSIVSDYYGQAGIADAWFKSFLQAERIKGVKSYPPINPKYIKRLLTPSTDIETYQALRAGITAGLTSYNTGLSTKYFPYGFRAGWGRAFYYIDINSSYPYQMSGYLPFGELYDIKPSKTYLINKQEKIRILREKILKDYSLSDKQKKIRLEGIDDHYLALDPELPPYSFIVLFIKKNPEELMPIDNWEICEFNSLTPCHKWVQGLQIIIPEELYRFYLDKYGKKQFEEFFEIIGVKWKYQTRVLAELMQLTYYKLRVKYKELSDNSKEYWLKTKYSNISEIFKLVLNSSFGKRMQRAFPTSFRFNYDSLYTGFIEIDNQLDPRYGYTDGLTGSVICARGRIYLKKFEDKIHRECPNTRTMYKDTDSLILDIRDEDLRAISKIINFDNKKLGAWKLEGIFDTWFCNKSKGYFIVNKKINDDGLSYKYRTLTGEKIFNKDKLKKYKFALGGIDRKNDFEGFIKTCLKNNKIDYLINFISILWNPKNQVILDYWRTEEIKPFLSVKRTPILYQIPICFTELADEEKEPITHELSIVNKEFIITKI